MSTTSNPVTSQSAEGTQSLTPTIIGIYGVSGCGKSHLSSQLKAQLADSFAFYEGSGELAKTAPGGLEAFKKMDKTAQDLIRAQTIEGIRDECAKSKKTGIVTGHYMFWKENADAQIAMTEKDRTIYTHILYLKTSPETVVQQVARDTKRQRSRFDAETIRQWQAQEEQQLRSVCRDNDIIFTTIQQDSLPQTMKFVQNTAFCNESTNEALVNQALDLAIERLAQRDVKIKTVLVLDADNTLAPYDASTLFWQLSGDENPLKVLFKSPMGYSHNAFRQMSWLYEENANLGNNDCFDRLCEEAAKAIRVYEQMDELLMDACWDRTIGVIVISCGLQRVWEKVLDSMALATPVPVFGNGRLSNGFVVTPETKGDIVARLQHHHKLAVYAFGDSEVDLPMLRKADQAFIVVGPEASRSKSFDTKLQNAVDNDGLRVRQALMPQEPIPRLNTDKIPVVKLDEAFFAALFKGHSLKIYDASDKPAAKLLTSSTRSIDVHGLELQQAHEHAGWYLATEYISLALGVETFNITSVQGDTTQGHRLLDEQKTCIVPLMRGGDPIARGVYKAFPTAMYHFAKLPSDIEPKHVSGMNTVILADWVINTGKGMVEFVKHIRKNLTSEIRIVMVAGVVQEEAVGEDGVDGILQRELAGMGDVTLVALRVSKNKYTGHGTTDTGHRLFNSTHLDGRLSQ